MTTRRYRHFLLVCTGLVFGDECLAQPTSSTAYEVVFRSSWSAATHPVEFPGNPHFSGLVGGTHSDQVVFWNPGDLASDGIESMAENGQKATLIAEVQASIDAGTAEFVLSGSGINPSPGSVSLTFEISPEKPLVTLVSMVAPSPDWFVGVHSLNMIEDGEWRDTVTVTLDVYDAGTDSGTSYGSANDDTDPPQPIAILDTGPFAQSSVVGTYTFTRKEIVSTTTETPDSWEVVGPYPNPATNRFLIGIRGAVGGQGHITVHDVTGRIVYEARIESGAAIRGVYVDVSHLSSSVYIVRMEADGRAVARAVIVR